MSRQVGSSVSRIWAMLLRYLYLLRSSWPRTLELLYWPTLQMLIWGFMSQFLYANSSYVFRAFGVLLAAVMLWDVLFRGQLGLSMSFLEEMWARNLGHLFVTPLRPYEWVLALLSMSMIRVLLGLLPAALLAIPLYHYSIFSMGLPLLAFFAALLIMGWALGLAICGLILRQGMGAEGLAWTVVFTLPRSAVFITRSPRCRAGFSMPPGRCHRPMYSKACERCCSLVSSGTITSSLLWCSASFMWDWEPPSFLWRFITRAGAARCCRWVSEPASGACPPQRSRTKRLLQPATNLNVRFGIHRSSGV
jgi:ABC-2 type transport system permease protein